MLEAARDLGTARVVHTSTSEVYGSALRVPIDESHPLQAQSPYAASKIAADKLAESYHLSFGVPVVTLRPFNTYGPRQSARAVIPTVVTQLAGGNLPLRLGLLTPTRDFNHVSDTVAAFVAVGTAPGRAGRRSRPQCRQRRRDLDRRRREAHRRDPRRGAGGRGGGRAAAAGCVGGDATRCRCDGPSRTTGWTPGVTLARRLAGTVAWFSDPQNLARYRTDRFVL